MSPFSFKLPLTLNIFFLYFVSVSSFPPFYGDTSLTEYLTDYCANTTRAIITSADYNLASQQQKPKNLFIVDSLQLESVSFFADDKPSNRLKPQTAGSNRKCLNLNEFLFDIDCEYVYLENLTIAELQKELVTGDDGYSKLLVKREKLQIIFDFCKTASLTSVSFYSIISPLAELYDRHHHLLPFLVLLNESQERLNQWASVVFGYFPAFRATLVSTKVNTKALGNVAVHIRPVLDGCVQLENGILAPKTKLDFDRLKVPFQKCNYRQAVLRVSVNNDFPFCVVRRQEGGKEGNPSTLQAQYSVETELLAILSRRYNFTAKLIDGQENWGYEVNGSWQGVIGQVVNGTSHFAICELSRTLQRLEVVTFTHLLFLDQIAALSQSPQQMVTDLLFGNGKIAPTVWVCLALSLLLVTAAIYLMGRFLEHFRKSVKTNNKRKKKHHQGGVLQLGTIFIKLIAINLRQTMHSVLAKQPTPLRLLLGAWMISGFVLSTLLSSVFYSSLAFPAYEPAIDSVEDILVAAITDSRLLLTKDRSSMYASFVGAKRETLEKEKEGGGILYQIGQHMKRHSQPMVEHQDGMVSRVEADRKNVILGMRISLTVNRFFSARKPLHISSGSLESTSLSWALRKRSPLEAPFNLVIDRLREAGLFDQLLRTVIIRKLLAINNRKTGEGSFIRYAHSMRGNPSQEAHSTRFYQNVSLFNMTSLFLFWAFSIFHCVLVFGLELLVDYLFSNNWTKKWLIVIR